MKNLKSLAGAAAVCGILTGCGPAKEELHVYTWSDYIAADVIKQFEEANNCKVVVDTFDSNEAMYAKLQAGSTGYDIIMPTSYQIPLMVKNKMIQALDHAKLPNVRKNFDKGYTSSTIDPSFAYGVPYAVTYTGLAYRKDKVGNAPVDSWKVFETASSSLATRSTPRTRRRSRRPWTWWPAGRRTSRSSTTSSTRRPSPPANGSWGTAIPQT